MCDSRFCKVKGEASLFYILLFVRGKLSSGLVNQFELSSGLVNPLCHVV